MSQKSKSHFIIRPRLETLQATGMTANDSIVSMMLTSQKGTEVMSKESLIDEEEISDGMTSKPSKNENTLDIPAIEQSDVLLS